MSVRQWINCVFVTCKKHWLFDYVEGPGLCRTVDAANRVAIVGKGRMFFEYEVSVNKFSRTKEMSILFKDSQVIVSDENDVIATGALHDDGDIADLFVMNVKVVSPAQVTRLGLMEQFSPQVENYYY
ncbi:hypothetical protein MIR68_011699 [Amoeboaphelidium protococcarum]|nr:hypothetical protein MIR68_011699 [Amoeboaphelidium protococcarum]